MSNSEIIMVSKDPLSYVFHILSYVTVTKPERSGRRENKPLNLRPSSCVGRLFRARYFASRTCLHRAAENVAVKHAYKPSAGIDLY